MTTSQRSLLAEEAAVERKRKEEWKPRWPHNFPPFDIEGGCRCVECGREAPRDGLHWCGECRERNAHVQDVRVR